MPVVVVMSMCLCGVLKRMKYSKTHMDTRRPRQKARTMRMIMTYSSIVSRLVGDVDETELTVTVLPLSYPVCSEYLY